MKNRSSKRILTKCAEIDDIIDAVAKRCSCKESITQLKEAPMKIKKFDIYLTKRFSSLTNNKIGKVFGITLFCRKQGRRKQRKAYQQR